MNRAWYLLLAGAALLTLNACDGTTTATSTGGKSAANWISAGNAALAQGDMNAALDAFSSAAAAEPNSAPAHEGSGQAHLRLGKYDKAVEDCTAALKINGKLTGAYFTRGQAEKNLGNPERALADFSKAIDLSSDRADLFAARGALYQQMAGASVSHERARKNLDSAQKDFDRALKLDARDTATLARRAEVLLATGDCQAAIDDCDKALEIDPDLAAARVTRALGFIEKGQIDNAIADCTAAITADPKRPDAYVVRAKARIEKSSEMRSLAAIAACDQAVDDCYLAMSLSGQIQGDAETLQQSKKWRAVVHELRGILYESLRASKKAVQEFDKAIAIDSSLADALVRRATIRVAAKSYDLAMSDCNAAIEIDRSRPEGYFGRGTVYRAQGDYAEALKDFNEALARKYPKAYVGLALTYSSMAAAENQKSLERLARLRDKRVAANDPEYKDAIEKEKTYCLACIDSATKALEINRHQPTVYFVRGQAYVNMQRPNDALRDFDAAIAEDPLATKAHFYRGVNCFNSGKLDESIKSFSKAIELQPDFAAAYRNRAMAYEAAGDQISANADKRKFQELAKKFKDEQTAIADHVDDTASKGEERAMLQLGPAYQDLVNAWKALEAKLDATATK